MNIVIQILIFLAILVIFSFTAGTMEAWLEDYRWQKEKEREGW